MNEEKAKILLRLYKSDLISVDEFIILSKEDELYLHTDTSSWDPNMIKIQPLISHYGTASVTIDATKNTSTSNGVTPNLSTNQHSTIGGSFSKKWINPEEPKFEV